MSISQADVQQRLRDVIDPNTGKDFVSGKAVKAVTVDGADVTVDILVTLLSSPSPDATQVPRPEVKKSS